MNKRAVKIVVIVLVLGAGAVMGWRWWDRGVQAESVGLRLSRHVEAKLTPTCPSRCRARWQPCSSRRATRWPPAK